MKNIGKVLLLFYFVIFSTAYAQTTKHSQPSYLFIQIAKSGSLQKQADDKTYLLTLQEADPLVTYFSEAPSRLTGFMPITDLAKIIQKGIQQAHSNGLNSGLIAISANPPGNSLRYVLDISNPQYDSKTRTIKYTATLLPGEKNAQLAKQINFTHPALFIDDICVSCGGGGF